MKHLLLALALALGALSIQSCTKTGTVPVSQALSPAAQAVQTAINETNILLAAAANVLGQQVLDGITPKAEAQRALDQIRGLREQADAAQKMLNAGDVLGSKTKIELANRLIVALHRAIAQRARKP